MLLVFCVGPVKLVVPLSDISPAFTFQAAFAKGDGDGSDSGSSSGNSGGGNDNSGSGNSGSNSGNSAKNSSDSEVNYQDGIESENFFDLLNASRYRGAILKVKKGSSSIEISYRDGWKEKIILGRYILFDANKRVVVNRRAKKADVARLNATINPKKPWAYPDARD